MSVKLVVISLENGQIHRYALELAGRFFQMVSNDYFLIIL